MSIQCISLSIKVHALEHCMLRFVVFEVIHASVKLPERKLSDEQPVFFLACLHLVPYVIQNFNWHADRINFYWNASDWFTSLTTPLCTFLACYKFIFFHFLIIDGPVWNLYQRIINNAKKIKAQLKFLVIGWNQEYIKKLLFVTLGLDLRTWPTFYS